MNTESYSFKVGDFVCIAINDGFRRYPYNPIDWLYPYAPKQELFHALREHHIQPELWKEWISPYICLFINTGSHQVIVDTGAGRLDIETGNLVHILSKNGIEPHNIDTVIFTHAHPDHIGGNTDRAGNLSFPKARHVMWKGEYDFWIPEADLSRLSLPEDSRQRILNFPKEFLPPIHDLLDLIDHEMEILPGIHALAAHGHTPGHIALTISSGTDQLLVVGDALVQPINIEHPGWNAVVDIIPEQATQSRCQLNNLASTEKMLVLAYHFPFPGLGHITHEGPGWKWRPIHSIS